VTDDSPRGAYDALERRFARLAAVEDALGILHWDAQTMMPPGAEAGRSDQLATLEAIAHDTLTAPEVGELLDAAAEEEPHLDPWRRANLREMRRRHVHAAAVPADLVEASGRAAFRSEMVWREARAQSDFALLRPHLAEVLSLQRQVGQAKGAVLGLSPYDALLDSYDPGLRQATIDPLFADLRRELPGLIAEARDAQDRLPAVVQPDGPFPVEVQKGIGEALMRAVGFDLARGRLDVSLHPFCGGASDDVRITTRYDEGAFVGALMGVLHESGHALYEQGRPRAWRRQPVGAARGMSLHESQSLLLEMQAGRSPEFLAYLAPLVREAFGGSGPAWTAQNLHRLYTRVEPGFIRVDADEVTYPAHILVRYALETAMIAGDLRVDDLPAAFDAGIAELLGLTVPNDRLGCLQDIHWPGGSFGYFPTYTLGAMAAAQFFEAACRTEPGIPGDLRIGEFGRLVAWLRANVHAKGSLLSTEDLLVEATGRPLDAGTFRDHLRRRYVERVGAG
jgi:carboxypeptidase Taq